MSKIILLIVLLLYIIPFQELTAQDRHLSRFRLLLKNGDNIEGEDGILTSSSLSGISLDGEKLEIPVSNIRALDQTTGSQALKGAGIGAGIGLISSLAIVLLAESDKTRGLKVNGGVLIGGTTVVCGLIGLLIGSASNTWERVPLNQEPKIGWSLNGSRLSIKIFF